ncbi:hydroxylamine reductase [Clostridium aminobutyricum]|uniref:Hydroxylamine reductase n=1 Tax=Clostridium aminobutyricum TaxID=33953 RepID=A0A939IJI3_CLOAM|nr:hydroxylamine reductase [Clostridium aminobutyricum]MBN7773609.1 hydroxylamine reductase [Clostridium aminobutyricum]
MDNLMFCYQCEQTAGGKGCTKRGVCGKTPEVAGMQDLLIYQLKGIAIYAEGYLQKGENVPKEYVSFIEDSLFQTLTNVNFDEKAHIEMLKKSQLLKEKIRKEQPHIVTTRDEALFQLQSDRNFILQNMKRAGIMHDQTLDADIRSLRETVKFGLKGIAAYGHQARFIGYWDDEVDNYYCKALAATTNDSLSIDDLVALTLQTGQMAVKVMSVLDRANNERFGAPSPHRVNRRLKKGPLIVISGHDLHDLERLLEQTENKGIHVYTHGEMLPSHGYEKLKAYPHLAGNFGGAWQDQQKQFANLPGAILMTTNCLMTPQPSYQDRIFTTSVVGFEGLTHIPKGEDGTKDFTPVINKALELGGFEEDEMPKEITVGFGHRAVLEHADKIVEAVKNGAIKRFFLIGGCDGAHRERSYYTEFAKLLPDDCMILTLACGKYRMNDLEFGAIDGIPRLLDVGQCNDSYSAIVIAKALADAFACGINQLPLSFILSWYEQKAVAVLLALLSLNVQNIYLGPVLPAFLSPNVLQLLVDTFRLNHISTPDQDLKTILTV